MDSDGEREDEGSEGEENRVIINNTFTEPRFLPADVKVSSPSSYINTHFINPIFPPEKAQEVKYSVFGNERAETSARKKRKLSMTSLSPSSPSPSQT